MKIHSRFLALTFFVLFMFTAHALEVREGKIKLILHEGMGRFSLYFLNEPEKQKYIPFIIDQDPRTSYVSIAADNKIYKLGEDLMFTEAFDKTDTGAKINWKSKLLDITEEFAFTTSRSSLISDGIKITLTVTNLTGQEMKIGVRYLIDTYLGEGGGSHFQTDTLSLIDKEVMITSQEKPKYWLSPLPGSQQKTGLQCTLSGLGVTVPDKVIFANWKRLNEATWAYTVLNTRDFNVRPYSINDSAVCQYYNPAPVAAGASRVVILILGNYSPDGYTIGDVKSENEITELLDDITKPVDTTFKGGLGALKSDINTVQNLINEIDKKIKAGEKISQKDLDVMKQILYELRERIKKYKTE
jgi:hypothetical protein